MCPAVFTPVRRGTAGMRGSVRPGPREGKREPVCSCREGFRGRRCHKVKKARDKVMGKKNKGKKKKKNNRRLNLSGNKKKRRNGRRKSSNDK